MYEIPRTDMCLFRFQSATRWSCRPALDSLGQGRGARFGTDFIFGAGATGDTEGADQFPVDDDRKPAFDWNGILQSKHEQPVSPTSQPLLKHLGRPLENRRGLGF